MSAGEICQNGNRVEIFLVEDHPIFRLGLRDLIEQEAGFHVCGEAESVGSAWNKIRADLPDLVIIDISLTGRNGLELTKLLKNLLLKFPGYPLSIITHFHLELLVFMIIPAPDLYLPSLM